MPRLFDTEWKTAFEPYRIKTVEPLGFTTLGERQALLHGAGYNLFNLPADKVLIDLLTDSGTSAMSSDQWADLVRADSSFAGSGGFYALRDAVRELTGYPEVVPVHQGRAAERILFELLGGPGKVFLSNTHFETTRANIEATGAAALDLPAGIGLDAEARLPFKGDLHTILLEETIRQKGARNIPLVTMTVTNNSLGGHPVSLKNLRRVSEICSGYGIPLFLDACRFAENACLIKLREPGYSTRPVRDIAREMFACAQGCFVSGKKDGLVNIGGFLAFKDKDLARQARETLLRTEGFVTSGGLAGRDLAVLARGLKEALDEDYLKHRIRSVEHLAEGLMKAKVPTVEPPGGHAVFVDAKRFLGHIPPHEYPAQTLACALYLEGGIRAAEMGSLMFGRRRNGTFVPAKMEWVRLALPRRVYTQSHLDFVVEVFGALARGRDRLSGLRLLGGPERLTPFTARLTPILS